MAVGNRTHRAGGRSPKTFSRSEAEAILEKSGIFRDARWRNKRVSPNDSIESDQVKTGIFERRMFPERFSSQQTVPGPVRAFPENVRAFNDNFETNSVDGRVLESLPHFDNPESEGNLNANDRRPIAAGHVKARGLRYYHFPDDEIPNEKIKGVTGAKVFGTVGKDNLPNLSGLNGNLGADRVPNINQLNGKISRGNIDYPDNLNYGVFRPIIAEMIADNQVGVRIINMGALTDELDGRYQRK